MNFTVGCCGDGLDRRRFLVLAAGAGLLAAGRSSVAAAEGDHAAMPLSCIDPRMVTPETGLMALDGSLQSLG